MARQERGAGGPMIVSIVERGEHRLAPPCLGKE
jgi:hypothetical protein